MADEPASLQSEEILALKSIYADDFTETPPSKIWKGAISYPEFVLKIKHLDDDMADRVFCHLHVKFSKTYPRVAPTISVESPVVGLSAVQVRELTKILQAEAAKAVGNVMIFELASHCQEYISTNNTASADTSLATAMTQRALDLERRQQRQAEEEANAIRKREEERAEQLATQIRVRYEEKLKAAAHDHEAKLKASRVGKVVEEQHERLKAPSDVEMFDKEVEISPGVSFGAVKLSNPRKDCLGTTWVAEPIFTGAGSSLPMDLYVVVFDTPYYGSNQGKKKLREVEKEIWRLSELRHPNLIRVYSVKLESRNSHLSGGDGMRLAILLEQAPSTSLRDLLYLCSDLKPDRVRNYIGQILSALGAVHSFNISHKGLSVDCIAFVCGQSSSDKRKVKLGRVGYHTRLLDLHRSNPIGAKLEDAEAKLPDSWAPPEALKSPLEYPQSRDMWSLGVILLQMLLGLDVTKAHADYDQALSFSTVPSYLQEFANAIFERKRKHVSCFQLLEMLSEMTSSESTTTIMSVARQVKSPEPGFFTSSPEKGYSGSVRSGPHKSRYQEDWEEVEFLGKGGFGSVVKARNKLDNRIYAVKKVKLRATENDAKIFREVSTLSRLSHRYIVRYFTTWLETSDAGSSSLADSDSDGTDSSGGTPIFRISNMGGEDSDPFRINLNDLTVPTRARSTSFPSIHFGEDGATDEDSDDDVDLEELRETSGTPTHGALNSPEQTATFSKGGSTPDSGDETPSPRFTRTLYIQMEFVERQTLKEAIEDGLSETEAWRLFHQILEALAHMSTLGILHRDIKPTNIFLNAKGDVKIGDFGLATSSLAAVDPSDVSGSQPDANDSDSNTSHVGTSLYVAPEVLTSHRTRSLSKADMYSLGIVLFEMNWSFKTGSERVEVLQRLRKPTPIFPAGFNRSRQKEIITLLLQHNPINRPSATELEKSPLLPARLEDENFRDALRVMVNATSPHYKTLLSSLFNQPADLVKELSFDIGSQVPEHAVLNDIVQEQLAYHFRLHGAIHMEPALLMPGVDKGDDLTVSFLDRHGDLVSLSRNPIVSAARLAARTGTERIKRFHIGNTYRPEAGGGHPRSVKVAMFDIITPDRTAAAEAEILGVVNECLDVFPGVKDMQYEFHLSHANFVEIVLGRIPAEQRNTVADVLAQERSSFPQKRAVLVKMGISRPVIDELEIMLEADTIDNSVSRLEKTRLWPTVMPLVDDIREAERMAQIMGVTKRKILFRPWIEHKGLFKDGIVFEVVLNNKRTDVIAGGGRYDHLIRRFSANPNSSIRALGVHIAMYRITKALADYQRVSLKSLIKEQRSFGPWTPRRCDVYIVSFQSGYLGDRLELAALLWQHDISADVMYDSSLDLSEETHLAVCAEEGILFLIYQRARSGRKDQVLKVKSVLKATEAEVHRIEIVGHIQAQLAEQKRIDKTIMAGTALEATAPSLPVAKEHSYDLQIILDTSNRKLKNRTTREIYDRKAQAVAAELKRSSLSGPPLICVDIPSTAFAKMSTNHTWIFDDDALRVLTSEFPSLQNPSTSHVREAIIKRKAEGHRFVYLLSLRDDKLHMFDFGS